MIPTLCGRTLLQLLPMTACTRRAASASKVCKVAADVANYRRLC